MTQELKLAAARVNAFVAGRGGALLASDLEALADHALAAPEAPDAGGWIPWGGGECPVAKGVLVDCWYRSGGILRRRIALDYDDFAATDFWSACGDEMDIIAYRLSAPQAGVNSAGNPS